MTFHARIVSTTGRKAAQAGHSIQTKIVATPSCWLSALVAVAFVFPMNGWAQSPLPNGVTQSGNIASAGGSDSWTFSASAGDSLMVRVGATNLTPHIQVYGPTSALVAETKSGNAFARDGFVTLQATNSGPYVVVVGTSFANQTGTYGLTLAMAPEPFTVGAGDQGGVLNNGAANPGTIELGDLDMWNFAAKVGDNYMLRVGSTNFTPWIRVLGPSGELVGETTSGNGFARDGFLTLQATNTGNYTVVLSAAFAGQSGDYALHLAMAPESYIVSSGDQGGALTNGAANPGTIDLGDLDMWNFGANAGDRYMLRVGSTNFTPWIRVLGPSGELVGETTSGNGFARDGVLTLQATNSGNYTVVLSATFASQSGDYALHLALMPEPFIVSPGDQGGVLTNGTANPGTIELGDLDMWGFAAQAGNGIVLRVGSTNFTPWIQLYGPSGSLVIETKSGNGFARDGFLTVQATNAGNYTVVLSATFAGQSGDYSLKLALAPQPFVVSPGDQGGALQNGFTHPGTIPLGDFDVWSFLGTPGDSNVLRVTAVDLTPWIQVYGPSGALVGETTSGNGFARQGSVNLNVTNAGPYTVLVSAAFPGQEGTYTLKESRIPPDLNAPDNQSIDESTPLSVSISAQDPDVPAKPLPFKLISGPPGMTISPAGSTNATLSWATTEADGPSTNVVVVTVTETVNNHDYIRTNSFTVVVNEVNTPPQLTVPGNQVLDELTPLNVSASAVDADLPPNPLTFSLVAPPDGMTINPATGAISWVPTEAQGPGAYTVVVIVSDDSPSAINTQHLSATNNFTVTVREVNLPPQLTVPSNQVIDELKPLNVAAVATDPDLPANTLTFSLIVPPDGMVINPATGAIAWTPTEAQGPSTNTITVQVVDNGTPPSSVTGSFTVVVNDVNSAPVLPPASDVTVDELTPLTVTNTATDPDIPVNKLTYTLVSPPAGAAISPAGIISWTPTEAQGPSTNVFTTIVTDDGVPSWSATNSFKVVVREVNTPPTIQPISDQSLHFGTPLSVQVAAQDSDLPANALTYSLEQPPAGATISAAGLISWTPAESQVGTYTLTARVDDNGSPNLSATATLKVTVSGSGSQLRIEWVAPFAQVTIAGDLGNNYELQRSTDLATWAKVTQFSPLQTSPTTYVDPDSRTATLFFYRLKLVQ